MTAGTSLLVEFSQEGTSQPLPPLWDEHLLRIGQEALTNAIRHGHAHRVLVKLCFVDSVVRLEVSDDGRGFDQHADSDGLGLAGMKARVASVGGELSIRSVPREGTTISVTLPILHR